MGKKNEGKKRKEKTKGKKGGEKRRKELCPWIAVLGGEAEPLGPQVQVRCRDCDRSALLSCDAAVKRNVPASKSKRPPKQLHSGPRNGQM